MFALTTPGFVKQRMHDNGSRVWLWPFDPKRCESRKLLALRIARVNREASCGKAIALPLGDRAEVGGTEKNSELVEIVRPIDRIVQAKARKAEVSICIW